MTEKTVQVPSLGGYIDIQLTDDDIAGGGYKKFLGGGEQDWEKRGEFQLFFLQQMGLKPHHKLLDFGCGPGRAAKYFIPFLEEGKYFGTDYNDAFVRAASAMVTANELEAKRPTLDVVMDFELPPSYPRFDYAIAFSVLNHCTRDDRKRFFSKACTRATADKFYVTHAVWFEKEGVHQCDLSVVRIFSREDFDITEYGWSAQDTIFPILELETAK